ncbi:MAG TPA: diphthamide biosynthesis enzyme Dph2 [Thermoplasmatales archaeon]|nr:diphthamide biosynthesis enzyme Dph2 [Thermoplasmatales archaeon]
MRIGNYSIDLDFALKEINENGYGKVLIQLPDGIKRYATSIARYIEDGTDCGIVISSSSCYGACDIAIHDAKSIRADAILHLGNLPIPNLSFPIPIIFASVEMDTKMGFIEKSLKFLEGKRVGIATTAQHINCLGDIVDILTRNGFHPIISKGNDRIAKKGLVLGCNFTSITSIQDKIDSVLFVGTGLFHPLGLAFAVDKPIIAVNPITGEITKDELKVEKRKMLKRRFAVIEKAKNANSFGVLVSSKPGQSRIGLAENIMNELKQNGKESYMMICDNIDPMQISNFSEIDCIISTACPRIALDDYCNFDIPILTPVEVEILLGKREISDYKFDTIY